MTLYITKEIIDKSRKILSKLPEHAWSDYCPITLAFKKQTGKRKVSTSRNQIIWKDMGVYKLPQKARDFVRTFDRKQVVKPFRFEAIEIDNKS